MESVAAYEDYRRAVAAAHRLIAHDHDARDIAIVATGFTERRTQPAEPMSRRLTQATLAALIAAISVLLIVAVLPWSAVSGAVPALVIAVVVAGAVGAGLSALIVHSRGRVNPHLVPTRYEVVCTTDTAEASHQLARWWESEIRGPAETPGDERLRHRSRPRRGRSAHSHLRRSAVDR